MSQNPSKKSRPMDAKSLALLLDIELGCTFVLQCSSASPPRGARRGAPSHEALDEILQRIAVGLVKLPATCDAAHDLLTQAERDAVKVLAKGGPRTAAHDAARRVLLAAVPRLFFETQALISDGREPWQPDIAGSRGPSRPGSVRVVGLRATRT